jgi:subtilisin family serine protease/subtilisin-like proprotein convertase family protein
MRRRSAVTLVTVMCILLSGLLSPAAADEPDDDAPLAPEVEALLDQAEAQGRVRVIVQLTGRDRQDAAIDLALRQGGEVVTRFEHFPLLTLTVPPQALQGLARAPFVLTIQEDIPEPPTLASTIPLIGANTLHAAGYTGVGQTVAILDTGIDRDHPAFASGRIVAEACFSNAGGAGGNVSLCPSGASSQVGAGAADAETTQCWSTTSNICDHGSHVAGIAAGAGGSPGSPGNGVAPGATIIAIQVFTRFNSTSTCANAGWPAPCPLTYVSDQLLGLQHVYSLRNTFTIAAANMSLGGGQFSNHCDTDTRKSAIDQLLTAGIATVIASGNSGFLNSVGAPGCISTAITVGSTTDADAVSSFSNRGVLLDLFAPGSSVTSAVPNNTWATFNGTSMAAPHVAGALAVLRGANPSASVAQLLTALQTTGVPITYSTGSGTTTTPRINLLAAFNSIVSDTQAPANVAVLINGGGIITNSPTVSLRLSASDNVGVTRYRLAHTQGGLASASDVAVNPAAPAFVANSVPFSLTPGDGSGKTVWLRVCDAANNCADASSTIALDSTIFMNAAAIAIPSVGAASPYPSNITVSGRSGLISEVTVYIQGLAHTWPSDIDVLLVGPGGQNVILMSDNGGSATITGVNLTFNDGAAGFLPASGQITSGTYKPSNNGAGDTFPAPAPAGPHGTALSVFASTDPNGTWSLFVVDDEAGDTGQIAGGWALAITTTDPPQPQVSINPTSLEYGTQPVGVPSSPQTVTLTNTGSVAVTISVVQLTGQFNDFLTGSTTSCGNLVLAPGSECVTHIVFTPSTPGPRAAELQFLGPGSTLLAAVPLSGTGQAAADTTPPVVDDPVIAFTAAALPDTTPAVPLTVSWSADDGSGSGVANYDVELSSNSGVTWQPLVVATTDTSATVTVGSGQTLTVRVRARDVAGNTSDWKLTGPRMVTLVQETPAAGLLTYGGAWNVLTANDASGGGFRRSPHANATITLTFTGSEVTWIGPTGANYGRASVSIDGTSVSPVDQYSPGAQARRALTRLTLLEDGPHTLIITALGQRTPPSTANNVGIDAFVILSVPQAPSDDTTPPDVDDPTISFTAVSLPSTGPSIPLAIAWSAADESGIGSYDLEQSLNGGGWTSVLAETSLTTWTITIQSGQTLAVRVRARDVHGNLSGFATSETIQATLVQESPSATVSVSGAWNVLDAADASGGTFRRTPHANASVTLTFTGTHVAWIGPTGTNYGHATVTVDGSSVGQTNQFAPASQARRVIFSHSVETPGLHSLTVTALGQRTSPATANNVGVDAFVILSPVGGGGGDTDPPVVEPPELTATGGQQPAAPTIALTASWSATDATGVATYDVEYRTNANWTPLLTNTTNTSTDMSVTSGDTVQVRVRARDVVGNTSDWVESAPYTATLLQDTPLAGTLTYAGAWNVLTASEASGGGFRRSPHATASVTLTFTGTEVSWIGPTGTNYGLAQVYLDGVLVAEVDLYSPSAQWRRVLFTAQVGAGTHTLEVRGTGQRNPASSANNIGIDAFVINGSAGS